MRPVYRRRRRGASFDLGEVVSLVLLGVIGVWGAWFGVQSLLTLWWPLNVAYLLAGLIVALISAAVARALLTR
jgi:1,4-dihydroxy-2-naphthoate octaprenyltransferase